MAQIRSSCPLVRRAVAVILLGLAGAAGLLALARGSASATPASSCTTRWTSPVSGSWSDATKWSTGAVPQPLDDVCVDVDGTYTLTLDGETSIHSLDLGGSGGGQRLSVVGIDPAGLAELDLAAPSTIRAGATLELDSTAVGSYAGASLQTKAPLVNHGILRFAQGSSGFRRMNGPLTNASDGQVQVESGATSWFSTDVVNEGTLSVSPGGDLTQFAGSFASQVGSRIQLDGPFSGYHMTFTQVGGVVSGAPLVLGTDATLADSAGAAEFVLQGSSILTGTIPAEQVVTIRGRDPERADVMLPGPLTNNGVLRLDGATRGVALLRGAGTLTNRGTIRTTGTSSLSILGVSLTNSFGATIEIAGQNTMFGGPGTTATNDGTVNVTATGAMYVDRSTYRSNPGSTLHLDGPGVVRSATFEQAGGTLTGQPLALIDGSTLDDSAGPGSFNLMPGTAPSTLRGTIPAGQTVTVLGTVQGDALATLGGGSVVNDGSLVLASTSSSGGATIDGSPLTNNGTLTVSPGASRALRVPITNAGTIDVAASTAVEGGGAIVNDGLVQLGQDVDLSFVGGSFTNHAGGTLRLTIDGAAADPGLAPSFLGGNETLSLAGTLDVATLGVPPVGTTFTPIFGLARTGTFSRVTGSVAYTASYTPTSVILEVGPPRARFVPLTPTRILDTRTGNGRPVGRLPAGAVVDLAVAGRGGVPASGAAAAVLTVTGVDSSPGYVTVWPSGTSLPGTSNLNTSRPGQTMAVQVVVPVGADGHVQLLTSGGGHLLADVAGWYESATSATSGRFRAVAPARLLDTRNGTGAPTGRRSAGATVTVPTAGLGGVPASGASAVILSVTGVDSSPGFVTVWPSGSTRPTTSNLNTDFAGQTVAAHVVVPLGSGGSVSLFTSGGGHLLVDVVGWFTGATAADSSSGLFVALAPERRLDTRSGLGVAAAGPRATHSTTGMALGGSSGIPSTGVAAVVANVTATQASPTFLTAWAGGPRPLASNLNVTVAGDTVANLVTSPVGGGASLSLYTDGTTHLLLDTFGYYLA